MERKYLITVPHFQNYLLGSWFDMMINVIARITRPSILCVTHQVVKREIIQLAELCLTR